jgi:oligopeptidase B
MKPAKDRLTELNQKQGAVCGDLVNSGHPVNCFKIMSTVISTTAESPTAPQPPVAKKIRKITKIHHRNLVDDYVWLREKSDPEVEAYLEAENAYADALMEPTKPLQQRLYDEMLSRIKETDVNPPYREGDWFYYSRTEQGKQYPVLCRRHARKGDGALPADVLASEMLTPKGGVPEEVTLDVNELAVGQSFMSIGGFRPSGDGNLLAYSTDNTGFRQYTLQVKDLRTGEMLPEKIEKTGSIAWANDNRTLFYSVEDAAKRHYRIYRHTLGTTGTDDLVFEDTDEKFNVGVEKTRSGKFLLITSGSHTTSEVWYLSADDPNGEWKLMAPRVAEQEYYADHSSDWFYIRTNDTGRNFRLVKAPAQSPGREHWQEVVPHRAKVMIEDLDLFKDFYVLGEREDGLPQLRITNVATGESHRIKFPEASYTASGDVNRVFDTHTYRYRYQSFIGPASVYDYDVEKRSQTLVKQYEVLGGYDASQYLTERACATAKDGARVPISLVYRKDIKRDGTAPIFLYAYGSYGHPMNIGFNSNRFSLIDRGVVFAVAHIRGGGDLGKRWHDDGRMAKKMNTFTDFVACAEYLVAEKYGAREKLVIEGGSAGGLLMGAVANMRPELFKAIVSKVPFVDVVNTMLDESLPLTVGEFEEWGNPKNEREFETIIQYSPYDNLAARKYPAMLVKTSFNDSQVMYWEPAKYVAKLRTMNTSANPLLLKTNMGAGHGGASGRYDYLHELAFDYAFILWQMGLAEHA